MCFKMHISYDSFISHHTDKMHIFVVMTHLPCARDQTVFFLSVLKCVRRDAKNLKGSKDTPGAAGKQGEP